MNFLQLCQRAAVECGAAAKVSITTSLPTVNGANGSLGRIVSWVGDAWGDLQTQRDDWAWMRSSVILGAGVAFQTVAGQASYPLGTGLGTVGVAADAFGKWDLGTLRTFSTATGYRDETFLDDIGFDTWRNSYMLGSMRGVQTRPVTAAVGPDQSINLGPPPNGLYTVTADYFVAPSTMAVDTDLPIGLPTRFHMLIVYKAMMKYAGYESAPEVYERGRAEAASQLSQLSAARAPRPTFGGALA